MAMGQYYHSWIPPNNGPGTWQYNGNIPYQQPINNVIRVTGPEDAKAYSLPPNSNIVLFDAENPIFYWKTTNENGMITLKTFTFEEQNSKESVTEQIDMSNFATKDDFDTLKKDVFEMKELLEGLVS